MRIWLAPLPLCVLESGYKTILIYTSSSPFLLHSCLLIPIFVIIVFSLSFQLWDSAIECIAILDVFVAMATYSKGSECEMCRPEVVMSDIPFLDIRGGRHPCVTQTFSGDDFIPNDVIINSNKVGFN